MIEGSSMDDPRDHFPIGMRVLAIDDDPTCLMVLETLLRRCQYHGMLLRLFFFPLFFARFGSSFDFYAVVLLAYT